MCLTQLKVAYQLSVDFSRDTSQITTNHMGPLLGQKAMGAQTYFPLLGSVTRVPAGKFNWVGGQENRSPRMLPTNDFYKICTLDLSFSNDL